MSHGGRRAVGPRVVRVLKEELSEVCGELAGEVQAAGAFEEAVPKGIWSTARVA